MKKVFEQFLKFGVVGIICFIVDFGLYNICNFIGLPYLISGVVGFVASVILNYILSMKYVFKHNENMSKEKELFIYIVLSVIGLILNEIILYLFIDKLYPNMSFINNLVSINIWKVLTKLFSTGVVMVYNFISRKIFIEGKDA